TRDSVDFPAPFAPSSACVAPARRSRRASTSAHVCPKLFVIARASRSVAARSVIASAGKARAGVSRGAGPTPSLQFVGEHGFFYGGEDLVDVLAGGDDDRHKDLLLRLAALDSGDERFA